MPASADADVYPTAEDGRDALIDGYKAGLQSRDWIGLGLIEEEAAQYDADNPDEVPVTDEIQALPLPTA